MATELNTTYNVKDANVSLTVKIGEGQFGSSKVLLDGVEKTSGDDITDYDLGSGSSLDKRTLKVVSVVSDTNPSATTLDVTYELNGGVADKSYPLSSTPPSPGGALVFNATFIFHKA